MKKYSIANGINWKESRKSNLNCITKQKLKRGAVTDNKISD